MIINFQMQSNSFLLLLFWFPRVFFFNVKIFTPPTTIDKINTLGQFKNINLYGNYFNIGADT